MKRRGRPRKITSRYPDGRLRAVAKPAPYPGKSAVYVIELADAIVKIGLSQDPRKRIKGLMTGHERPAMLVCCFWMASADAAKIERKTHKILRQTSAHAHGEIYYLDAETAISMIKVIIGRRVTDTIGIERFEPEVSPARLGSGKATRRKVLGLL